MAPCSLKVMGGTHGQAFIPLLGGDHSLKGPPGRIIQISSVAGAMAVPFGAAYSAAKFGLEGFSHALRIELRVLGIPVSIVGARLPNLLPS